MSTPSNRLLLNSSVAFVLAAMVITTLHELAHAITGIAGGSRSTLYPNEVSYLGERTTGQELATAAAGPIFSLLLGLILIFGARNLGSGFWRLFWLWAGFMSAQNFFGYMFIAPFARAGDTGRVLELLEAPGWLSIVVAILGYAGILWLAYLFAAQLVRYTTSDGQLRSIAIFSWLIGTGVMLVLTFLYSIPRDVPGDVLLILFAAAASIAIFAPQMSFFYKRFSRTGETLTLGVPTVGIILTVVLSAFLVLVLTRGLSFG